MSQVINCPNPSCSNGRVSWTTSENGYERDPRTGDYVTKQVVVHHEKDCPQCGGTGAVEVR